jgi:iron-sulfur cluster repair protein YtfE (RIC family)
MMRVTEVLTVRGLVRTYPQTRGVFDRYGLRGCGGVDGPAESIRFFARAHGVDLHHLLRELEKAIEKPETPETQGNENLADTIYRRFFKAAFSGSWRKQCWTFFICI